MTNDEKLADAVNALNSNISSLTGGNKSWISGAELNDYKSTGVYYIGDSPTFGGQSAGVSWSIMVVLAGRSDTLVQIFYKSDGLGMMSRQYRDGNWKRLITWTGTGS